MIHYKVPVYLDPTNNPYKVIQMDFYVEALNPVSATLLVQTMVSHLQLGLRSESPQFGIPLIENLHGWLLTEQPAPREGRRSLDVGPD